MRILLTEVMQPLVLSELFCYLSGIFIILWHNLLICNVSDYACSTCINKHLWFIHVTYFWCQTILLISMHPFIKGEQCFVPIGCQTAYYTPCMKWESIDLDVRPDTEVGLYFNVGGFPSTHEAVAVHLILVDRGLSLVVIKLTSIVNYLYWFFRSKDFLYVFHWNFL
jgi:hypothetical protein